MSDSNKGQSGGSGNLGIKVIKTGGDKHDS